MRGLLRGDFGCRIVTASDDKTARVWDARSHKLIGHPLHQQRFSRVRKVQAGRHPDRHCLVTKALFAKG
ncbi:MAG: hypothetical protein WBG13_10020, partial [Pseudolabrys sp.]